MNKLDELTNKEAAIKQQVIDAAHKKVGSMTIAQLVVAINDYTASVNKLHMTQIELEELHKRVKNNKSLEEFK